MSKFSFLSDAEQFELLSYSYPSYDSFIGFVRRYLAPHMKSEFVEEEYYRVLWEDQFKHRLIDAQISRGHSKSELLGVWSTIYFSVFQPVNPFYSNPANGNTSRVVEQLVVSSDQTTTGALSDRIKEPFMSDEVLMKFRFKDNDSERKWNSNKIELMNGSVIHFRSIKMKRGLHVDRVVADDLTTELSTLSDHETWNLFTGALLPMTQVKQAMIMIDGTPIRVDDIMGKLSRSEEWHHIKLPAIVSMEMKMVLSPKRFTFDSLMQIKRIQGTNKFEAEYMLNPIDDSVSLIKLAWLQQCRDPSLGLYRHRSNFDEVFLGVDFAFSDKITADFSVFFILGHKQGKFYMLDYVRRKGMSGMEQLEFIRELNSVYKFDAIGLEANSIKAIIPDVRNLGLPIKLFNTGNVDERDKAKPDLTGIISVSKRNLVLRLGTTFENRGIILPFKDPDAQEKISRLCDECVSWAQEEGKLVEMGVHPDIPIALGYALEVATKNMVVFDMSYNEA